MQRTALALLAAVLPLMASPVRGEEPCVAGVRTGNLDRSLPCQWLSPIVEGDSAVLFAAGSAALSPEAMAILDRQAEVLRRFLRLAVETVGFADTVEAPTSAERTRLGKQRAMAAGQYLIDHGVAAERITASGRPDARLVAPPLNPDALAAMRMVRTETRDR